jgi:hypothetical protein
VSALWVTLSVVGLLLMVVALARIAQSYRPDPSLGDLPATPLERLGWVGLAVTGAVAGGLAILVLVFGVGRKVLVLASSAGGPRRLGGSLVSDEAKRELGNGREG